jgi:hypothetical protein
MLIGFFFYMKRIVHRGYVPSNTMVNSDFYCDVLRSLRENVQRKIPGLGHIHSGLLHHNNVHALTSVKTTEFVTNSNMVIGPHHPYSLDLAPCDFALFLKVKMKLSGRHFEIVSDIQRELQVVLDNIKENDFHGAFEACKKRWDRCIRSPGDYFEGDGNQNLIS